MFDYRVDFHADPQFQWREYPENRIGAVRAMLGAAASRLRLWIRAVRAPFFTATLVPMLLGAVIAHGDLVQSGQAAMWSWTIFWLALLGAILAQASTNLANDPSIRWLLALHAGVRIPQSVREPRQGRKRLRRAP